MTLSIMEDHKTFKTALTDYKASVGDIPKILERYLEYVARTGKPLFPWAMIHSLILKKFETVCDSYIAEKCEDLKIECLKSLNDYLGVPFTIQRICELLLTPRQNYSRLDKFLRGFIKVLKVVTTVDRLGQKITTESQSIANETSPFNMNETGDSWSSFTDDSGVNVQEDSPLQSNNEASNEGGEEETKNDIDYEDKSVEDSMSDTLSQFKNNKQPQSIYSDESFFMEQKTISMPPIGALFKPIDQLEAFVQNVSSQVENNIESSMENLSKKRPADDSNCRLAASVDSVTNSCSLQDFVSPAKRLRREDVDDPLQAATSSTEIFDSDTASDDLTSFTKLETINEEESQQASSSGDSQCAMMSCCAEVASSSTNDDSDIDCTKQAAAGKAGEEMDWADNVIVGQPLTAELPHKEEVLAREEAEEDGIINCLSKKNGDLQENIAECGNEDEESAVECRKLEMAEENIVGGDGSLRISAAAMIIENIKENILKAAMIIEQSGEVLIDTSEIGSSVDLVTAKEGRGEVGSSAASLLTGGVCEKQQVEPDQSNCGGEEEECD